MAVKIEVYSDYVCAFCFLAEFPLKEAVEGYQYAKTNNKGNEYNDRMFRAFFQEEQDIGEIDVLTELAGELGLDKSEFREALEKRQYREAHQAALRHAVEEVGVTAVPAFVIGEHVLAGVQKAETLEKAIAVAQT